MYKDWCPEELSYSLVQGEHSGWCLNQQGITQNSGAVDLGQAPNKEDCWRTCRGSGSFKGCQYHSLKGKCAGHTKVVVKGSGSLSYKCLIL